MKSRDGFLAALKVFLDEKKAGPGLLASARIYVCNQDGVLLYQSAPTSGQQWQAIGPLAQGAWQAAYELLKIFTGPQNPGPADLRLGFDHSESGFYMVPLPFPQEKLSLCCCYSEVVNVGQLKNQLRMLKEELLLNFTHYRAPAQDQLLFADITDDEVSNLFAGIGN